MSDNTIFTVFSKQPSAEQLESKRNEARRYWWQRAQSLVAWNESNAVPAGRRFEPAIDPVDGFATAVEALKVKLPGGKARQSRSDRLGNATGAIRTGLEALKGLIDSTPAWSEHALVQAVVEAGDEMLEAVEEAEGVEFPGMFG